MNLTVEERRDRYRGCLLGLAAGDALGATLEFMEREQIARQYGRLREMVGGGWLRTQPGEYTDDTQMMLAIARSIVDCGGLDHDDIAARFVAWLRSGPRDVGITTRRAIEQLAGGVPWQEAGSRASATLHGRDASNGSLMRTAPIALFRANDRAALVRDSADVSRITHANPLAIWSCVALDLGIARALQPGATRRDVLDAAASVEHEAVRAAVREAATLARGDVRSGGYVLDTLRAALWSFARHGDAEEVIVEAVNLGGDADTTGAVAGALAGAFFGASHLPARWLQVLQGRDELTALADELLVLSSRG